jgi:hypothetical protein
MQRMLKEMGHPQTCTLIQTDNSTFYALLTNKIMPKVLNAMDMQFHWLHCHEAQDQYSILFTGDLEPKIWWITGPSIIQPATTKFLATNPNVFHK